MNKNTIEFKTLRLLDQQALEKDGTMASDGEFADFRVASDDEGEKSFSVTAYKDGGANKLLSLMSSPTGARALAAFLNREYGASPQPRATFQSGDETSEKLRAQVAEREDKMSEALGHLSTAIDLPRPFQYLDQLPNVAATAANKLRYQAEQIAKLEEEAKVPLRVRQQAEGSYFCVVSENDRLGESTLNLQNGAFANTAFISVEQVDAGNPDQDAAIYLEPQQLREFLDAGEKLYAELTGENLHAEAASQAGEDAPSKLRMTSDHPDYEEDLFVLCPASSPDGYVYLEVRDSDNDDEAGMYLSFAQLAKVVATGQAILKKAGYKPE